MNYRILVPLAFVALMGCHRGGASSAPTGQVAATAAGQEITASDVQLELGALASDPQAAAAQQPNALKAIINRKLLVKAATDRGIDKTPVATMLLQKAHDLALIQLLERSIEASAPKVSKEEANTYIQSNPSAFAGRQLITVDQLVIPRIAPALIKAMQPLNTLDQITALLDGNKVPYRRTGSVIDSATIDPSAARQIGQLKVGAVFVTPAGGGAQVSRIKELQPQPLSGDQATQLATAVLSQQRAAGLAREQFSSIIESGQKTVKINAAYQAKPSAQPKAAAK